MFFCKVSKIRLNLIFMVILVDPVVFYRCRSMLYNGSDVIRDVEWVIFDEVHYVNDAEVR